MTESVFYEDLETGNEIPGLVKRPTTAQLVKFAGASGDYYPIHYDKDFALASGLPSVIVHGWLTLSFLSQMVTDWMGEGGSMLKLAGNYRGMNLVNEDIVCHGKITKKYTEDNKHCVRLEIWAENPRGERTASGSAVVALPAKV
jgi:acyl dehydratase